MNLSKLLEKISEKYPDDKDVIMALEMAPADELEGEDELMEDDDLSLGSIMDIEPEAEGSADIDVLLGEDLGEDEEEMPKKKSAPKL